MKNVFTIDADIKLNMLINEPTVVQNDDIRFIINVFDGGQPLSLDSATTVSLASVRLDRQTVVTPGIKIGTNTVQFDLGTEETKFPGRVKATAQFYDSEGRVSTISFSYRVVKDPTGDGYVPSKREQTLIETVLNDGPLVIQQAQDAANFANEQGQFAQTQANAASEAAANANEAATNANAAADNANTAASNANTKATYAQQQGDYAKAQGDAASLAVENANNALAAVNEAVNNANTAIENANVAADNANLAAERANNEANYAKEQGDYAKAQAELIDSILEQNSVASVNGKTGNVILTAEDVGAIPVSEKGVVGGVARLNEFGKVVDASGNEVEGKVKTVNGIGPDENGNIEIETATSWNDLSDKPNTFPPSAHTHQISEVDGLHDALNEKVSNVNLISLEQTLNEHLVETTSKFTSLNVNMIDMAVELETLKGATLNGVTANIFIETFQNLDDINLMNGIYDNVNKRLVL